MRLLLIAQTHDLSDFLTLAKICAASTAVHKPTLLPRSLVFLWRQCMGNNIVTNATGRHPGQLSKIVEKEQCHRSCGIQHGTIYEWSE